MTTCATAPLSEAEAAALAEFADREIRMICSDGGRPDDTDGVRREARKLVLMADLEDALDAGIVPFRMACDTCMALIGRADEAKGFLGRHPERDPEIRREMRELHDLATALVAHARAQVPEAEA